MKVSIIVAPGTGHKEIEISSTTKLGEVVGKYSNRGTKSVMINGRTASPDTWDAQLANGDEVWLMGGVKAHPKPNPTPEERLEIINYLKKQIVIKDAFQEMIDIWRTDDQKSSFGFGQPWSI